MTFAEFENLPETPGKQELIDGELITMPPPELSHVELMKVLYDLFRILIHPSRVWPDSTGYRIAGGWIQPDVSVSWPDQLRDNKYFLRAPMLAVEILSADEDFERKLTLYFAEGAAEVWAIDRKHKAMTVYLMRSGEVVRIPVEREYYSENVQVRVSLADLFFNS
jgi:Uma2 family endonuclease